MLYEPPLVDDVKDKPNEKQRVQMVNDNIGFYMGKPVEDINITKLYGQTKYLSQQNVDEIIKSYKIDVVNKDSNIGKCLDARIFPEEFTESKVPGKLPLLNNPAIL